MILDFELSDKVEKLDSRTKKIVEKLIARIKTLNIDENSKSVRYDSKNFYDEIENRSIIFPLVELLKSCSEKIPQNEKLTTNWELSIQTKL